MKWKQIRGRTKGSEEGEGREGGKNGENRREKAESTGRCCINDDRRKFQGWMEMYPGSPRIKASREKMVNEWNTSTTPRYERTSNFQ